METAVNATLVRIHVGGRYGNGAPAPEGTLIDWFAEQVNTLVTSMLAGATIYEGTGIWQGVSEPCIVIEVLIADDDPAVDAAEVTALVLKLKDRFWQDAIMVTRQRLEVDFS